MSNTYKLLEIIAKNYLMYVEDIDITHSFDLNIDQTNNYAMELDADHPTISGSELSSFIDDYQKEAPTNYKFAVVDNVFYNNIDLEKYNIVDHNGFNKLEYDSSNYDDYYGSGGSGGITTSKITEISIDDSELNITYTTSNTGS